MTIPVSDPAPRTLVCEVLAVGTELLLGSVDTNSPWMGERLAEHGFDCYFHSCVGDNPTRIAAALRLALSRSDSVLVCGGLGPTQDDLTREVIAQVMGVELQRDDTIAEGIRAKFRARNRDMPANNLQQAYVPMGARIMSQWPGTAPGLICPLGDRVIYAMPGVPAELKAMFLGDVLTDLHQRSGIRATIQSRVLRTWGESESRIAELVAPRLTALDPVGNPTIAFLAKGIEGIFVRITAKAADATTATALLAAEEQELRALLGQRVFGVDDDTMESVVLADLAREGLTLGVAESLTGGYLAQRLTGIPGASRVFRGGIVSYHTDLKRQWLGVTAPQVVSAAAAAEMAVGAQRQLGCDVALSTTGVAGPDPQDDQPVGQVFIGLAIGDAVETFSLRLPGNREQIRQFTVINALNFLRLKRRAVG